MGAKNDVPCRRTLLISPHYVADDVFRVFLQTKTKQTIHAYVGDHIFLLSKMRDDDVMGTTISLTHAEILKL